MKRKFTGLFLRQHFLILLVFIVFIVNADSFKESPEKYWNFSELSKVPSYRVSPFADSKCEGLQDFLVEGEKVDGEKAEFFAYFTYPDVSTPEGGHPAVLLIHGGGGTAYPQYVKLWADKGYAVMALDWYNQRPLSALNSSFSETNVQRAELEGGKRRVHTVNVANITIAHSLLRSFEKINKDKTIFVGLSWGSWYGAMLASVDPRFKGGIEIYCGNIKRNSDAFINGRFHHAIKVPLYWITGTNDENVHIASIQDAYDTCPLSVNKSMVIKLPHSHVGFTFPACFRMAEYFLNDGIGLPKLGKTVIEGSKVSCEILEQGKGIKKIIFCFTKDRGKNVPHKRIWESIPAEFNDKKVHVALPEGTFQCFFSAYDEESRFNDLCGSSDLLTFD